MLLTLLVSTKPDEPNSTDHLKNKSNKSFCYLMRKKSNFACFCDLEDHIHFLKIHCNHSSSGKMPQSIFLFSRISLFNLSRVCESV